MPSHSYKVQYKTNSGNTYWYPTLQYNKNYIKPISAVYIHWL